jgi:hypothetical protein
LIVGDFPVFRKLVIIGILLLFALSMAGHAFAQGAASGESQAAFEQGRAPAVPATRLPGLSSGPLSYATLAGMGKGEVSGGYADAMVYNPFSAYGPYGIYGQYGVYGPYGMYGPGGPGYGSGLGFNGFGMNDPWALVKIYNEEQARSGARLAPV